MCVCECMTKCVCVGVCVCVCVYVCAGVCLTAVLFPSFHVDHVKRRVLTLVGEISPY